MENDRYNQDISMVIISHASIIMVGYGVISRETSVLAILIYLERVALGMV